MGDNGDLEKEEIKQEEPKSVQLIITMFPDGKVNLSGPITNRIFCYGLLKMAEEILYDFSKSQKIDLVKPTSDNIMDLIRRK